MNYEVMGVVVVKDDSGGWRKELLAEETLDGYK
jgi:hypothetical protein